MYPDIPGLKEHFKGKQLHSHYYRDPQNYKGTKNAVVLAGGLSSRDISLDLTSTCQQVYLCHRLGRKTYHNPPDNFQERPTISHVKENGDFVLTNDDVIQNVDLLVICTGYHMDFPFFNSDLRLSTDGNLKALDKLYKHIFHVDHPSLCFIGIPKQVLPFPLMHQQCAYVTAILAESASLPSKFIMEEEIKVRKLKLEESGQPKHHFHTIGVGYTEYIDELATISGIAKNAIVHVKVLRYLIANKIFGDVRHKDMEFKILNDEEFEVVKSLDQIKLND